MYFLVVGLSFGACSLLYIALLAVAGRTAEDSCSTVSLCHHVVAFLVGAYAHWLYWDRIAVDASFGQNTDYPLAVALQHFNIGYFLYDTIHVAVWDQKFLLHHIVALAGYGTSEISNVFGLANAVNTWITEIGSLMYSAYLVSRTTSAYHAFVGCYTISRAYFLVWSFTVFGQVRQALSAPNPAHSFPAWAPYCAASLQFLLLAVNLHFLSTHWLKLFKSWRGGNGVAKKRSD